MNNSINIIQKKIKLYYKTRSRKLPWRRKGKINQNPYETLISEVMLQQTRVSTVLKYYKNFLEKFPNLKALALAKSEEVLKIWSGMGYYRRAINLHNSARIIIKKYDGKIPSEKEKLKKLPGIGEYTSSAIASFAFGKDEVVIDTNVDRFISRIFNINYGKLKNFKKKAFEDKLFPRENKGDFAQAVMDFSNEYCLKLNPKCDICIISKYCNYEKDENITKFKIEKKKKYCTSYFIYDEKNQFFVRKRPINKILGGMYEIPSTNWNSKVKSGERCKKFENFEKILYPKINLKHEFSHFILFSRIRILKIKEKNKLNVKGRWVNKNSLKSLPYSSLTKKIVCYCLEEISSLNKFL